MEPLDDCESSTCTYEQPHRIGDHGVKAAAQSLTDEEQPKAESKADINRTDDPQIDRPQPCNLRIGTEQADPKTGVHGDDQSQRSAQQRNCSRSCAERWD